MFAIPGVTLTLRMDLRLEAWQAEEIFLLAVSKEKVKLGMFAKTQVSADVESDNGAIKQPPF